MNKLFKLCLGIIGADLAATSVVFVHNAIAENKDSNNKHNKGFYEKYVKRPCDFFFASGAFVALSPALVGTAIAVRTQLGSPVLFTQDRPGKEEKVFKLFKFRSMSNERNEKGELLPDEIRLTNFGKRLRSTSLDELPELINIIKGDMSIVGPRPLVVSYLPFYTDKERQRHRVRPGLTGIAQINGRNDISWEEKFAYDIEYVNTISFFKDTEIIIKTIAKVIKREGIGQGENSPVSLNIERRWEINNEE